MKPLGSGDPIRLGPYRILGVLGEGGMGKVYFARDNGGAVAAVKVLLPELAHDPHLAQRFLREAHTAQAVTSGGVARVLGAQSEDSRPWIATEFLAGPTLDEAVRRYGPFGADGVRALAAALAATLRDIHAAGLVHRDLKPANIVLTSTGPRVIDFGIARPEHGLTLTTTGQVPVTPGYGAPEQVLGQRVGPAADVFSLGAVLAYAATGQRAFDGTHVAAVQYEVVHGEARLGSVPDELRHLIAPCLAKEAAYRPTPDQVGGAFAPPRGADLAWRKGPLAEDIARRTAEAARQAVQGAPGGGPQSGAGPSRRRLLRTSLAAGGVLAASGGATGAWWLMRDEPRRFPAAGLPSNARPLSLADARSGAAPKPLWGPLRVAAQPEDGSVTTPLPLRDVVVFAAAGGGLAARLATDGKEKWRLADVSPAAGVLALSENWFTVADEAGALHAFEASTGKPLWSAPDADAERLLAADESAVYLLTRDWRLRCVETRNRTVRWTAPIPAGTVEKPGPRAAVGRDALVVSGTDGTVITFDTATGAQVWKAAGQAPSAMAPLIHKDIVYLGGRSLTARVLRTGVERWSAEASEVPQKGAGGWGPLVLGGDFALGMNGTSLCEVSLDPERGRPVTRGRAARGPLPHTPPVVQGRAIWVVEPGGQGVSAYSAAQGVRLWTWAPEARGAWALSGAWNRVFLVNGGKLTAMPTVG
ncbi:PQQ-binding-like beta-propeller repeat protein [Streptomyces sp. NPDC060031]|uniref:protein kinase domain-containing protein n=1 Tax=Streptomyces sp. NPDC060031 TaxID=3347043 RepID=UPI003673CA24